jgi:hypothetical protein
MEECDENERNERKENHKIDIDPSITVLDKNPGHCRNRTNQHYPKRQIRLNTADESSGPRDRQNQLNGN